MLRSKTRKLFAVRIHRSGIFGVPVGHKARLLSRSAALRVVKRLRRSGLEVTCDAMHVVTTSEQRELLDRRAANTARRLHRKSRDGYKGAL